MALYFTRSINQSFIAQLWLNEQLVKNTMRAGQQGLKALAAALKRNKHKFKKIK